MSGSFPAGARSSPRANPACFGSNGLVALSTRAAAIATAARGGRLPHLTHTPALAETAGAGIATGPPAHTGFSPAGRSGRHSSIDYRCPADGPVPSTPGLA